MKTAFCFDLDGTVTSQEILPLISKSIGIHEEINLLTTLTLKGLIPFETSFKLRVRLLSQISISLIQEIVAKVKIEKKIKEFIRKNKHNCYIITGNLDCWVGKFISEQLGCKYYASKANFDFDQLRGIKSILNKGHAIDDLRRNEYENIITIGDSMNDCSMFEKANLSIAFGGVHNPVESLIQLSNYVVYDSKGLINLLNNLR